MYPLLSECVCGACHTVMGVSCRVVTLLLHAGRVVTGLVTTLAGSGSSAYKDGQGTQASFYNPVGVAVDSMGTVYVGDTYNNRIRKVTSAGERSGRWIWTVMC